MQFIRAIILACSLACPAAAATLEKLDFDRLVTQSTFIVRASVVSATPSMRGPMVFTMQQLRVSEVLKGTPPAGLQVATPGGVYGNIRQMATASPQLETGKEYLLFLWQGKSGLIQVIGLTQGIFELHPGQDGQLTAYRPAPTDAMFDSSGKPVSDPALARPYRELRDSVTRSIAATKVSQ